MNFRYSHFVLAIALSVLVNLQDASSVFAEKSHQHDAIKIEKEISDTLAKLSSEDRKLVEAQRFCPMMAYERLGSMGAPIKLLIEGKPVFVCCKGCSEDAVKGGKETLAKASKLTEASAVLAKLTSEDRAAAESQKYCAVAEGSFLGGMGAPIKLTLNGKPVFLCCKGCVTKAQANPGATLAKVDELKKAGMSDEEDDAKHKEGIRQE